MRCTFRFDSNGHDPFFETDDQIVEFLLQQIQNLLGAGGQHLGLDAEEQPRKAERAKRIYAQRKETIARIFADAKEKRAMRYSNHRGLATAARRSHFNMLP